MREELLGEKRKFPNREGMEQTPPTLAVLHSPKVGKFIKNLSVLLY